MKHTYIREHVRMLVAGATAVALLASTIGFVPLAFAAPGGPTVVLTSSSASTTNTALIPVTATFSESVTGVATTSVTATNATVSNLAGSGAVYTFDVMASTEGAVTVTILADEASSTASSTGNQVSNTLTFTYDATGPTIIGTTVAPITDTTAQVNWTTNELSSGQVNYGTTSSYTASSTLNASSTLSHVHSLSGLTASTTYHYQVVSVDGAGNISTSSDATFTTASAVLPPVISNVTVTAISTTSATVGWTTDVPASSQVSYGTTTSYGTQSALNSTASTTHSVVLTGLSASTLYHYQAQSANSAGTTTSSDGTFTTSTASSTPTITNITVTGIGSTTATVGWTTSSASNGQVSYGTSTSYGTQSALNTTASTTHSVALTNLAEGTVYHFQISSADGVGTTTSSDGTFVTLSTASSTPLAVDSTTNVKTQATADNTYANGWEWSMRLTVPDSEGAFRMRFSDFISSQSTIPVANNLRFFSAQSSNANSESTAITESNNNYSSWMYLSGDASTSTPGTQINVTIQMKIPTGSQSGSYTTNFGAQSVAPTATSTTP